jgi:hypothetical protein
VTTLSTINWISYLLFFKFGKLHTTRRRFGLAKWAPRMMRMMPRAAREEVWGTDIDWEDFNLDELMWETIDQGETEPPEVKSRDSYVRIFIEE